VRSKYQQELKHLLRGSRHLPNTILNSTTRILTSKVWYHISLYNEQCGKLAIHFAEHNFGPFGHNFFVIVSFEPKSKTLFRVLFSSLCLQIVIFYFGIYRIFYIFSAAGESVKRTSKQSAVYIPGVWKNRKSILQIKVLQVAWFARASGYILDVNDVQ
jgi:hypothetical protein